MHTVSVLLFALSSNIDNFVVGLSYGIHKNSITFGSNLIIGIITFLGTLLSMLVGKSLLMFIPEYVANMLGGIIVFTIGLIYLIKLLLSLKKSSGIQEDKSDYDKYDRDKSGVIEWREAFAVGFALSVNNIGLGVSASISGLNVVAASMASFACSLLAIFTSNIFGRSYISKVLGKYAEPIASIMIMILGLCEIFM